jgi:ferredoxin
VPQLYIDPVECIDCGACVPVCPVSAIFALDDLPEKWKQYTELNESYVKAGKYTPKSSPNTRTNSLLGIWPAQRTLSNAFPSAFKELDPIPQLRATVELGEFLEARFSRSF